MCKCAYKHCLYVSNEIKPEDDVVRGTKHYHRKCCDAMDTIKEIIDVYYTKVSSTVVMTKLVRIINNIVFTKQVDCHYLLFALKQAIAKNWVIRDPASLQYMVDDYNIKKKWESEQGRRIIEEAKQQSVADDVSAPSFKVSSDKPLGFDTIFGGG